MAKGLSIIFISHKLGEILAACSRVSVLRGGKLVAERGVEGVTRSELAELMVGRSIPQAKAEVQKAGDVVLGLQEFMPGATPRSLTTSRLISARGEIFGIAGVSGNGQSLLADVVSGVAAPTAGTIGAEGSNHFADKPARDGRARGRAHSGGPACRRPDQRHEHY